MFWPDVIDLKQFYSTALGQAACAAISRVIRRHWRSVKGESILAVGFAPPYLIPLLPEADSIIACMPAAQGVIHWPSDHANLTFLADEGELPVPDNSINRALLVHSLENSEQVRAFLQEIWRVLAPTGRVLVIVPNRRGIWARAAGSPFAHGHPYTPFQLRNLLMENSFTPLDTSSALFFFPSRRRFMLRLARVMEMLGSVISGWGGVIVMEAEKQIYAPTKQPVHARRPARIYEPVPSPALGRWNS